MTNDTSIPSYKYINPRVGALMRLTSNLVAMTDIVEVLATDYIRERLTSGAALNPKEAFSEAIFSTFDIREMLAERRASCDVEQLRIMLSEFISSEYFVANIKATLPDES